MSIQEEHALKNMLRNWKLTPATMAQRLSKGTWIPSPHLQFVSAKIAAGIRRGGYRGIIAAPPRHGKSNLIDIYTPTWHLDQFPDRHTILASYGADLSEGFGRQVRDLIEDRQDVLSCKIRQDARQVAHFELETGGSMTSVGVGGPITGRGAHLLVIDDYIKEVKEALSQTYRDYIWNWFVTTAMTRLEPGASVVIIATRWHSDDLIGRILRAFGHRWEYIELPAIATKDDILGRTIGEPLFPERYPLKRLLEIKEDMGSIWFEAMFQQRPIDETASLTDSDWLKYVDRTNDNLPLKRARVWDLAASENKGDYTCGGLYSYDTIHKDFYIEEMVRGQFSPRRVQETVISTANMDGRDVTIGIEQEPGSAGKSLIEFYKAVLWEFEVVAIPVTKSKVVRANPLLAAAESGHVYLVRAGFNKAFAEEFEDFPDGKHDDQIDTASAAYIHLAGKKQSSATFGRQKGDSGTAEKHSKQVKSQEEMRRTANLSVRRATFGRHSAPSAIEVPYKEVK